MEYKKVVNDLISYVMDMNKLWVVEDITTEKTCRWKTTNSVINYIMSINKNDELNFDLLITDSVLEKLEEEIKSNLYEGGIKKMYLDAYYELRKKFEGFMEQKDERKLKFIIYLYYEIKNNLINSTDEIYNHDYLASLNFDVIDMTNEAHESFLSSLLSNLSKITKKDYTFMDDYVLNIDYDLIDKMLQSGFESLPFEDRLMYVAEIFLRMENGDLFSKKIIFKGINSGFKITNNILDFMNDCI